MNFKKIALIGFRLSGGGCGRVIANLSSYFIKQGIEVHIIIFYDEIGYDFSGKLYNLGKLKSKSNTIFNKIKRFIALKKYVKQEEFDVIIDFRFRKRILQEYLISRFVYNPKKTIYTIHSSQLETYLPKSKFWANVIYGKAYKVIVITKAMQKMTNEKYPKLNNVEMIYNPINTQDIKYKIEEDIDISFEYIIGVGQYNTDQKQFDKLIEAYSKSNLPNEEIHLVILGTGSLLKLLKNCAIINNIESKVHFLGFKQNPFKYMEHAKLFVLSSWHEGHPMVLIESLACNTPVIAFDCPTGPREVVLHKKNGLLIEDQNIEKLTYGLDLMIRDKNLYGKCRNNALNSVKKFEIENIGKQWLDLIDNVNGEWE